MNEAMIVLMLVTANGIHTGPNFQTFEECELVSTNIRTHESFCYFKEPVNINLAIDQLGDMINQLKNKMNETHN